MQKFDPNLTLGIVTPSFNQAEFLEQAIDSVLSAKSRVPLVYGVVDGGSTDGSKEIIQKYEKHLDFWVSESDTGQSNAINKGLRRLHFDAWGYLNSDDYYVPGALEAVHAAFAEHDALWVTGIGRYFDEKGPVQDMSPVSDWEIDDVIKGLSQKPVMIASQVSNFMSRKILDRFGYFDETLHYTMDVEFGLRPILAGIRPIVLPRVIGMARLHNESKTVSRGDVAIPSEIEDVLRRLDLQDNPKLAQVRNASVKRLSRRNALNRFLRDEDSSDSGEVLRLLRHLLEYPSEFSNREVLGAFRRRFAGYQAQ